MAWVCLVAFVVVTLGALWWWALNTMNGRIQNAWFGTGFLLAIGTFCLFMAADTKKPKR